ncbi:hypothetical protein, partial [Candidatus Binatus sp.]|uniref:hypothetical protein n=1 Tax=Candidatus Binatus sp. TaxID=2811406 RepID=UPI003CC51574
MEHEVCGGAIPALYLTRRRRVSRFSLAYADLSSDKERLGLGSVNTFNEELKTRWTSKQLS